MIEVDAIAPELEFTSERPMAAEYRARREAAGEPPARNDPHPAR